MNIPLKMSFKDMVPSDAVATVIRQKVARLESHFNFITSCRVIVHEPNRRHNQGRLYYLTIDVTVPGRELAVGRNPAEHHAHEDIRVAIRDAFLAIERKLKVYRAQRKREIKVHVEKPQGRVIRIFPNEGCGFLETFDGREIYFHDHSVLHGDFERLRVGARVRFDEEPGDNGPQASTVELVA